MPRLSAEVRAQRRQHVLASAWRCFSQDGFHATSMDDIIAATGMSSSAVYRYFRSKDEIIDAAAAASLALISEFFARLLEDDHVPTPREAITGLVHELAERTRHPDYDLSKIAIHAWAEALRRPELAARSRAFYLGVRERLDELARRWHAAGYLEPCVPPEAVATMLLALMPGLIVTRHLVGPVTAHELTAGMSILGIRSTT
jgi:AcrR family transcriptional regulator